MNRITEWRDSIKQYNIGWYVFAYKECIQYRSTRKHVWEEAHFELIDLPTEYIIYSNEQFGIKLDDEAKNYLIIQNSKIKKATNNNFRNDAQFVNMIRLYSSEPDSNAITMTGSNVNEIDAMSTDDENEQNDINQVPNEGVQNVLLQPMKAEHMSNTLDTIVNVVDGMGRVIGQNEDVMKMYNDVKGAVSLLVGHKKWRNNDTNQLIHFENEKEKKQLLTLMFSTVACINDFSKKATNDVCNLMNSVLAYCNVPFQFNVRYTTMIKNLMLLTEWNNMRLSALFKSSVCYCLCFDEQSSKKYKSVGVTCRFITAQLNMQEELVTIDLYDEGSTGAEYLLYLSNIIEKNGEDELFKVVGLTTDGAANMRAPFNGLVTLMENRIMERFPMRPHLFIAYYCLAHRHNLAIRTLCERNEVQLLLTIGKWLSSVVNESWNKYCIANELGTIPTLSQTRWCYASDIVEYLLVNYDHICIFLAQEDFAEQLKNYIGDDHYTNTTFYLAEFKHILIACNCILTKAKSLNIFLQSKYLLVRDGYNMVIEHIKELFGALHDIEVFKERHEYQMSSLLLNYFSNVPENPIVDITETITELVTVYLNDLMRMFMSIEESIDDDELVQSINTYELFELVSESANSTSTLYHIIKLIEGFENQTFDSPEGLPEAVMNEYMEFVQEYQTRTVPERSRLIITDCILLFGVEKYKNLFFFIIASYAILPTSCSIESTFSRASRTFRRKMANYTFKGKMMAKSMMNQE